MKLVGVLILMIIAVFIIVMLMTFLFHLLFIIPIATTAELQEILNANIISLA
jgi:hypothetical protein